MPSRPMPESIFTCTAFFLLCFLAKLSRRVAVSESNITGVRSNSKQSCIWLGYMPPRMTIGLFMPLVPEPYAFFH